MDQALTLIVSRDLIFILLFPLYRYTYNAVNKSVYAILLEWPADYSLTLASVFPVAGSQVSLLGHSEPLTWKMNTEGYVIILLPHLPFNSSLQHAWTLKFNSVYS